MDDPRYQEFKEFEKANDESYRVFNAYHAGWEDARKYFRENIQMAMLEWKTSEYFTIDLEDLFANPEDEMEQLRKAALNRGQP